MDRTDGHGYAMPLHDRWPIVCCYEYDVTEAKGLGCARLRHPESHPQFRIISSVSYTYERPSIHDYTERAHNSSRIRRHAIEPFCGIFL